MITYTPINKCFFIIITDGFKQHIKNMFNKFSSYWFTYIYMYIYIYIYESYHSEYKEYLLFQKNLQMYVYIYIYIYIYNYIYIYKYTYI